MESEGDNFLNKYYGSLDRKCQKTTLKKKITFFLRIMFLLYSHILKKPIFEKVVLFVNSGFNSIQPFRGCSRMGGSKKASRPLPSVTHILQ